MQFIASMLPCIDLPEAKFHLVPKLQQASVFEMQLASYSNLNNFEQILFVLMLLVWQELAELWKIIKE